MSNGAHVDAGTHPPVLFLTGIGLTAAVALRPIAALEAHFQVLAPPLGATAGRRGSERARGSRAPTMPWRRSTMPASSKRTWSACRSAG